MADRRLASFFEGHQLTPAHRRIARFLSEQNPTDAGYLSVNAIATGAGVSQPSVSRFALALGFPGFNDLRAAMRQWTRASTEDDPAAEAAEPTHNRYQALVDTELAALTRLRGSLGDGSAVRRAIEILAPSRPLPVVGLRVSAPLAVMFGQFAEKLLPDVRVFTRADSVLLESIHRARRSGATCLLAFAFPRYPRELATALATARTEGLQIVLVTDEPFSAIAETPDHVVMVDVNHELAFDSYAAPTALCAVLLQELADSLPSEAVGRLDDFDDLARDHQFFVT